MWLGFTIQCALRDLFFLVVWNQFVSFSCFIEIPCGLNKKLTFPSVKIDVCHNIFQAGVDGLWWPI